MTDSNKCNYCFIFMFMRPLGTAFLLPQMRVLDILCKSSSLSMLSFTISYRFLVLRFHYILKFKKLILMTASPKARNKRTIMTCQNTNYCLRQLIQRCMIHSKTNV